jgi:6-phosphogluconate dehydrogenase
MKAEIGLIGLGVMGKSLSRNLARNGFCVSLYNRHVVGKEENVAVDFKAKHEELTSSMAFDDLKEFVISLETPRKIILMVNAGPTVDFVLNDLNDFLEKGDVVIDGGNSHYEDTARRIAELEKREQVFIGTGVSGGEEGALLGPSIMPSGPKAAYTHVQQYLEAIAATDSDGNPCCTYIGKQGSGHFVKMIHNGIEYVEMQLLAECYSILKSQGASNEEMASTFKSWREDLDSYLLEITVQILRKKEGDRYLLDMILDKAGNKGTGNWATVSIASSGEPATMIPSALFARYLSFFKERRITAATVFSKLGESIQVSNEQLKEAYEFARIINHAQGFSLINLVSEKNNWGVNLSELARIWTGGCIIKSDFMKELVGYLQGDTDLLSNENLSAGINRTYLSAKAVAAGCIEGEIHAPCLVEAVNYFNGLKTGNLSANLIQAQRDYFGSHTYQRTDDPNGEFFHTEW